MLLLQAMPIKKNLVITQSYLHWPLNCKNTNTFLHSICSFLTWGKLNPKHNKIYYRTSVLQSKKWNHFQEVILIPSELKKLFLPHSINCFFAYITLTGLTNSHNCLLRVYIWMCVRAYVCSLNCIQLFVTPRTIACQAPLSMRFSRQEYWSGLPFPSPGDLPNPGIKPVFLVSLALTNGFLYHCTTYNWMYLLKTKIPLLWFSQTISFSSNKVRWSGGKESACQCRRHRFNPWVGKIPWKRKWQPIPVFLPGKFHGERSLEATSP